MNESKQLSLVRLSAFIEHFTNDNVYGISREDRKILNLLRGVNDFAESKD